MMSIEAKNQVAAPLKIKDIHYKTAPKLDVWSNKTTHSNHFTVEEVELYLIHLLFTCTHNHIG